MNNFADNHGMLLEELRSLETELHKDETRRNRQRMETLLHADFLEVGRSGGRYKRSEILEEFGWVAQSSSRFGFCMRLHVKGAPFSVGEASRLDQGFRPSDHPSILMLISKNDGPDARQFLRLRFSGVFEIHVTA